MTRFADIAPTIAKLLRLLASDKDGEIVASVHALRRVLGSANLDLHDLASVVEFSAHREAPQIASATADDDDAREMIRRCCECSICCRRRNSRSFARWRDGAASRLSVSWRGSFSSTSGA